MQLSTSDIVPSDHTTGATFFAPTKNSYRVYLPEQIDLREVVFYMSAVRSNPAKKLDHYLKAQ
jgi:hypothetical protein